MNTARPAALDVLPLLACFILAAPAQSQQHKPSNPSHMLAQDNHSLIGRLIAQCPEGRDYIEIDDMRYKISYLTDKSSFDGTPWTNAEVNYVFASTVPLEVRSDFMEAATWWSNAIPISFIETATATNYIIVVYDEFANPSSFVGMQGDAQALTIGNSTSVGNIAHELGHALGAIHEHQRSDRNQFVLLSASIPDSDINYQLHSGAIDCSPYDFESIMHYPTWHPVYGQGVLLPTPGLESMADLMGQRDYLTSSDILGMAVRYDMAEPSYLSCSVRADNSRLVTMEADLRHAGGDHMTCVQRVVEFRILSGTNAGQLIGDRYVVTINGTATIQVAATEIGGAIEIGAFSPGLGECSVFVTFPGAGLYEGLVAYYPFDGNANDVMAYGHNGVVHGATLVEGTRGEPASAYYFDGVDDEIRIADLFADTVIRPYTVLTMIRTTTAKSAAAVYSAWRACTALGDDYLYMVLYGPSTHNRLRARTAYDGMPWVPRSLVTDGQWHQVGSSFDGVRTALIVDGHVVAQSVQDNTVTYSPAMDFVIGAHSIDACDPEEHFEGVIDDVRFYNRAVSSEEILQLYAGQYTAVRDEGVVEGEKHGIVIRAIPNPFNPMTTLRFELPVGKRIRLEVYDARGKLVRSLRDVELPAGNHQAVWDGRDEEGRAMASGSYFARLSAGGSVETVRMGLVR